MTALLSLSNARYVIPNWFLERNVKTAAELAAAPDQILLCTCGDCKKAKADDDDGGARLADEDNPDKVGHEVGKGGVKELDDYWISSLARGLCSDEIYYKTFAELRDITAAAFVTGRDGKLVCPESSAVVFHMEKRESSTCESYSESFMEPLWMSRAVKQVAKVLGLSLVALDLDELEELGCDFYNQDKEAQNCKTSGYVDLPLASTSERRENDAKAKEDGSTADDISIEENGNKDREAGEVVEDVDDNNEYASSTEQQWHPDVCSLSAFLRHFFAARAKRHAAAESWQRTQLVWTIIFEAIRAKLATEGTASDMTGGIFRPSAVIFHITDYMTYPNDDDRKLKKRVLARFAQMLQERRKQGDTLVMIVSTQDTSLKPQGRLQRKIGARPASTMVARDVKLSDNDLAIREQNYRGIINTRALRRCLRNCCAHLLPADLLDVTADWACAERGKSFRAFGGTMWTSTDMGRIVTQIMGRAWLKPRLTFADVRVILNRLGLYQPVEPEAPGTPERSEKAEVEEKAESEHSDESATNTFEEDISKVLEGLDLNGYETALTERIVDGAW